MVQKTEWRGKRGRRNERKAVSGIGAKPTVNSGATCDNADGLLQRADRLSLLVEHKATSGVSMRVEKRWLDQTIRQARERGAVPCWMLNIGGIEIVAVLSRDFDAGGISG